MPYRNQISAVRRAIGAYGIDTLSDITIDTVERYQGSQRDIIIYCTTVTCPNQMELIVESTAQGSDSLYPLDRKLNVALTRARQQLFVIGIPHVLETDANYRALMQEL